MVARQEQERGIEDPLHVAADPGDDHPGVERRADLTADGVECGQLAGAGLQQVVGGAQFRACQVQALEKTTGQQGRRGHRHEPPDSSGGVEEGQAEAEWDGEDLQ